MTKLKMKKSVLRSRPAALVNSFTTCSGRSASATAYSLEKKKKKKKKKKTDEKDERRRIKKKKAKGREERKEEVS